MTDNASRPRKTCLAAVETDGEELMLSSSGGVFSILARRTLDFNGVVYGHAFDDSLHVSCVRAENIDELSAMRGSKYVQSDMGDAISSVGHDLSAGREVLFSGTPCQIDGLLAFLGGPQDRLLTVDIVCHGVPSQAFFADCMGEEFAPDRLLSLRFRDKHEGWGCGGSATILHAGIEKDVPFSPEISYYYKRFLAGDVYRESCYRCPYASGERPGDFTIGDFWGIDVGSSGLDSRRGISVVIANTAKAEMLIPYIKNETSWAERPLEEAVRGNDQLQHPSPRPESRDVVLKRWKEEGIGVLEDEYRRETSMASKKWLAKRAIKIALKGFLGK